MFDASIRPLAEPLIADGIHRQREAELAAIQQKFEGANGRGILTAGFFHAKLVELAVTSLRARSELIWEKTQEVMSARGVVPDTDLVQTLTEFLVEQNGIQTRELAARLKQDLARAQSLRGMEEGFDREATRLLNLIAPKVELFVASLASVSKPQYSQSTGTVQNFYGGVFGAIQTGANSSASVQQSVSIGDVQATSDAIAALSKAVENSLVLVADQRAELVSALEELRIETTKPSPSRFKLSTLANGLAVAVQTSANVKGAYELFRTALSAWGINLPIFPQ